MPGVKGARHTLKAMRTLAGACVADDAAKAGFVCACAAGWGGGACAEDVNECDSAPCSNGVARTPCEGSEPERLESCNCESTFCGIDHGQGATNFARFCTRVPSQPLQLALAF